MLLPNCGPLPQITQTCAMTLLQILWCFVLPQPPRRLLLTRPAIPSIPVRDRPAVRGAERHTAPRLAEYSVYPEMAQDPNCHTPGVPSRQYRSGDTIRHGHRGR